MRKQEPAAVVFCVVMVAGLVGLFAYGIHYDLNCRDECKPQNYLVGRRGLSGWKCGCVEREP